jgi:hypothetical protein
MVFNRRRRAPLAAAGLALVALVACGGDPAGPTPSASPSPRVRVPGGTLAGSYLLEITPSTRCAGGVRTTFLMEMAAANTARTTAVQGTHAIDAQRDRSALEIEAALASNAIRGGFATRHDGVLSQESVQVWVHAIGQGSVTSFPGSRGEILDGTLVGYLAYSGPGAREGALGSCTEADHQYRLTTR